MLHIITMKCEMHPDQDALGTCVSCGRGVCAICKVNYQGLMHCKQCLEAGRIGGAARQQQMMPQMYYPYGYYPYAMPGYYYNPAAMKATPKPRGIPDGRLFKLGAVGSVGAGIMSIIAGATLVLGNFFSSYNRTGPSPEFMASAFLMAIFQVVTAFGFLGYYKNYGPIMGLVAAGFMAPTGFVFIGSAMASSQVNSLDTFWYIYLGVLFVGIGHIVAGVVAATMRKYLDSRDAPMISCIMFIIGGGLLCAFIGVFIIGWVFSAIGYFLLSAAFFSAPVPPPDSGLLGEVEVVSDQPQAAQPYPTDSTAEQYPKYPQ